jgi:hypothetical protein
VLSSLTAWSCPTHRFAREKWVKAIVEWIETFFGHIKHEWPHLNDIGDPVELERELARLRIEYNTVSLHEAIGYVTPDDEHHGRGEPIREARRQGLQRARQQRLDHNRRHTTNHTEETP